jgi:ankyrin repeat protein
MMNPKNLKAMRHSTIHKYQIYFVAAFVFLSASWGCAKTPHERLGWKAEKFFTDAGVLSLCKAIEAKELKEINRLVKSGVDVNAKGRGNMTPLLWAFPMGESVFGKLLELGADPNIKLTEDVWSMLRKGRSVMSAVALGDLLDGPVHDKYFYDIPMNNYLKIVLEHGGNPNIEDSNDDTPLLSLCYSERSKVSERIRLLLDAGADINHRNKQGMTTLINCIFSYYFALDLLKFGADYRIADNNGFDAILFLEKDRRFLQEQQSDPNDEWTKFMMIAAQPLFNWLAKEGVNWDAARKALNDKEFMQHLKDLPADYQHRPWLPQRPTLKKPEEEKGKPK